MFQPPHHIALQVERRLAEFEEYVQRERLLREAGVVSPLRLRLARGLVRFARRLDPELSAPRAPLPSLGRWVDRKV